MQAVRDSTQNYLPTAHMEDAIVTRADIFQQLNHELNTLIYSFQQIYEGDAKTILILQVRKPKPKEMK